MAEAPRPQRNRAHHDYAVLDDWGLQRPEESGSAQIQQPNKRARTIPHSSAPTASAGEQLQQGEAQAPQQQQEQMPQGHSVGRKASAGIAKVSKEGGPHHSAPRDARGRLDGATRPVT